MRRLRVLMSVAPVSSEDNPYISLLMAALPANIEARFYDKWRALFGAYDVFHMHWPEHLLRGGNRMKVLARRLVFSALLLRIRFTPTVLVRTVHNVAPHEDGGSRLERFLLNACDSLTTSWIVMNRSDSITIAPNAVYIPHGTYLDWYGEVTLPQSESGRILYFGLIRRYKGVPALMRAFGDLTGASERLIVAGACGEPALRDEIEQLAVTDARVELRMHHLEHAELLDELGRSELVVLPYEKFGNSGALLLALSFSRPVLAPATAATLEYQAEFGEDWLRLYHGALDTHELRRALEWAAGERPSGPNLRGRDWASLGARTGEVYWEALRG